MRRRLIAWALFIALVSSIAYASRFASGPPDRNALYKWSTAVSELFVFGVIVAVTLAITGSQRQLLALRQPYSWRQALTLAVPVFIAVFVVISVLDRVLHGAKEQGLVPKHWEPSHAGAYAANFVVIAGVAPFAEELLFRGLGYSLFEPFGRWTAILTVGIAFGFYHGLVEALPELALFGCVLAWLRSRTGSVYPGMLAHATFNTIGLLSIFF
jgi:membrane protease YdiL (CAAX protease family)